MSSRPRRLIVVLLFVVILISAALSGCSSSAPAPLSTQSTQERQETPDQTPPPAQAGTSQTPASSSGSGAVPALISATVTRVIDGDTAEMRLSGGAVERVRFIGVDTPESTTTVEPYGKEASSYTARQLASKTVYLELDVEQRDKYGRLLAYVWLARPGSANESTIRSSMFNARLLLDGYAQVMTVPPNVKYSDLFLKFQREAREKGVGLWALPAQGGPQKPSAGGYVGNKNSMKFHRPDCQWAQKISPQNRVEFGSREEAIGKGYVPCKVCKP